MRESQYLKFGVTDRSRNYVKAFKKAPHGHSRPGSKPFAALTKRAPS